jgi:HEAT repeat protein
MDAAYALGKVKDPNSVDLLVGCMSDPFGAPTGVAMAATWALGELGDQRATAPVIEELRTGSDRSRRDAALTLAKMPSPEVIDALIEALGDPHFGVRVMAGKGLHQIGGSAIVALAAALTRGMPPGVSERQFLAEEMQRIFPHRFGPTSFGADGTGRELLEEALRGVARYS